MSLLTLLQSHIPHDDIPKFAISQGIGGILYQELTDSGQNPFDTLNFMRLTGAAQKQSKAWQTHKDDITRLSHFTAKHNINILIFKGYALSLLYTHPETRKCGDLDVYFFKKDESTHEVQSAADTVDELIIARGTPLTPGTKHTSFDVRTTHVENHHHFVGIEEHPRFQAIEDFLLSTLNLPSQTSFPSGEDRGEASTSIPSGEDRGEALIQSTEWSNVYYPSPNFNAAFLPIHLGEHFVYEGATIRQLIDWAVFLKQQGADVDWPRIYTLADQCGCRTWLNILNALAIHHFSIDPSEVPNFPSSEVPSFFLRKRQVDDRNSENKVLLSLINSKPIDRDSRAHNIIKYMYARTQSAIRDSWKIRLIYDESPLRWYIRHAINYVFQ